MENKTPTFPWWIKILVGILVGGVIFWKTPVLELVTLFFWVVLIPVALLASVGLIGQGTMEAMGGKEALANYRKRLADRIDATVEELKQKQEVAAHAAE